METGCQQIVFGKELIDVASELAFFIDLGGTRGDAVAHCLEDHCLVVGYLVAWRRYKTP